MTRRRNTPAEICYVIDATKSMEKIFPEICSLVLDICLELKIKYRRYKFYNGIVIFRDPVDYKLPPVSVKPTDDVLKEIVKIIENDGDNLNEQSTIDKSKYPSNQNFAIQFIEDEELLEEELQKVECYGGNDEPEDWVGALNLALYEMNWSENSKKCIIWISDSNAHGKRFCGFDNHNEEEEKMVHLIHDMIEKKINFIGINLIRPKNDSGCDRTLHEMRDIFSTFNKESLNFIINEFTVNSDNDGWPDPMIPKKRMSFDVFDDF